MKPVTLYRHNDSSARMAVWKGDQMTKDEMTPEGSELIVYTKLPNDVVEYLLAQTKDKVNEYLSSYLP